MTYLKKIKKNIYLDFDFNTPALLTPILQYMFNNPSNIEDLISLISTCKFAHQLSKQNILFLHRLKFRKCLNQIRCQKLPNYGIHDIIALVWRDVDVVDNAIAVDENGRERYDLVIELLPITKRQRAKSELQETFKPIATKTLVNISDDDAMVIALRYHNFTCSYWNREHAKYLWEYQDEGCTPDYRSLSYLY